MADVDAHGRQTCEGVLAYLTNRVVCARGFRDSENKELFLHCFENTLSPIFELVCSICSRNCLLVWLWARLEPGCLCLHL